MAKDSLLVRNSQPEDVPQILHIIKTAFAEQKGLVDPPSSAENKTLEIVERELETATAIVVGSGGKLIACVFYKPVDDEIYIDRLAVLPEFRKLQIGKMLMEEIESRAKHLGFWKLSLSVRIELTAQQDYYRRIGYEITSSESQEGFGWPTYVVMKKNM